MRITRKGTPDQRGQITKFGETLDNTIRIRVSTRQKKALESAPEGISGTVQRLIRQFLGED